MRRNSFIEQKIIYIHQYFKFPNQNGSTRSYDLAKQFSQYGYNINIISSTSDEKYSSKNTRQKNDRQKKTPPKNAPPLMRAWD